MIARQHLIECECATSPGRAGVMPGLLGQPLYPQHPSGGRRYEGFMSIAALKWALELPLRDMAAKIVLIALADPYSEQNECCWPSIARLKLYTGATERTIQRAIRRLENLGYVRRHQRPRKTSIFELSLPRQDDAPTPSERRSNPVNLTGSPRHNDGLTLMEPQVNPKLNHKGHERGASRDVSDARAALKDAFIGLAKQSVRRMQ